jgi:hypothetical protein
MPYDVRTMRSIAEWLVTLLENGEAVISGPPVQNAKEESAALTVLARAFDNLNLDLAGPALTFDSVAALSAAHYVAAACWSLFVQNPAAAPLDLQSLGEPRTSDAHLSADVTLRYLPTVHRRAMTRAQNDPLAIALAAVLRQWPLSGILANLPDGPIGDLSFAGHAGLQLLYAERFVEHENQAWLPPLGAAMECVELVYQERGRPLPTIAAVALESPDE